MRTLPPKIYVNVYPPFAAQAGIAYATLELANQMAASSRIACIEVDIKAGKARPVGHENIQDTVAVIMEQG